MGFYIEVPANHDKVDLILAGRATGAPAGYRAEVLPSAPDSLAEVPDGKALICVVSNGLFEAAGHVYSDGELEAFNVPSDPRPRIWLLMDANAAFAASGAPRS
jgi:hypothetical protein